MDKTRIDAMLQALIQQRDIAQAAYVNLCGENAILQEKVKLLEDRLKEDESEVVEVVNG